MDFPAVVLRAALDFLAVVLRAAVDFLAVLLRPAVAFRSPTPDPMGGGGGGTGMPQSDAAMSLSSFADRSMPLAACPRSPAASFNLRCAAGMLMVRLALLLAGDFLLAANALLP